MTQDQLHCWAGLSLQVHASVLAAYAKADT